MPPQARPSISQNPKSHHAPKPPPPPVDHLADLRAEFGTDDAPERAPEPLGEVGPPESPDQPGWAGEGPTTVTDDTRDDDRAIVIAAWHADTVATGFLHNGERCGCRYIANLALDQVRPVQANPDAPA